MIRSLVGLATVCALVAASLPNMRWANRFSCVYQGSRGYDQILHKHRKNRRGTRPR